MCKRWVSSSACGLLTSLRGLVPLLQIKRANWWVWDQFGAADSVLGWRVRC